ncbi:hypothetical protein GCM10025778_19990 [Paeniglutamicibacter antarcticus]|uniref:Uncharacterized protein n=1 Tax=Paeniglutamicibacter antarcticus TaxID=494023 RepID=A0ABP9TLH4_9MICC
MCLDIEREPGSWAELAAATSRRRGPYTQSADILPARTNVHEEWFTADGWRYGQSEEGNLDLDTLERLAAVLSRHTGTPESGVAAIWEGWGSGVSMPYFSSEVQVRAHRLGRLLGGLRAARSTPAKQPKPACLELPGRTHQFYAAGISAFSDRGWPLQAPWILHDWISQSPSLVWPDDRAWVMVTEVDYDSTIIAGSQELVTELLETDRVEAFAVGEDVEEYLWAIPERRWSQPPGECPGLWPARCRGPAAPPWLQDRSA